MDTGGTIRPRTSVLGRLLHVAKTILWMILPIKRPLTDGSNGRDDGLLTDTKQDEPPKHHIRIVAEHLRSRANADQSDETLGTLDVIADWISSTTFPLETSKVQPVVNHLQQVLVFRTLWTVLN